MRSENSTPEELSMKTIEIESMPRIQFAHAYSAEAYNNLLPKKADCIEVTYLSEGTLHIAYQGTQYTAHAGDIICLPYCSSEIHVFSDAFHAHCTVMAQLKWSTLTNNLHGLYLPLVTPLSRKTKAAKDMIEELVHDPLTFKESKTKGAAIFLSLLCEIDRCNRIAERQDVPSEAAYTRRAKEYIQRNIHAPITQREIAEHLSITPEYLCYVFKKCEGISVIRYCNTEKLEAIRALMEKERIHLYEASALFGYSDPNYVSRLYKKYYGHQITKKPLF
jgi:AraC-like DNA-binding protein